VITRIISLAIGGVVAWILLLAMNGGAPETYVTPLVVGAVAAFFWPVVIGFYLARRARDRQEARIQSEVERQLNGKK
jgi:hypothetical protein